MERDFEIGVFIKLKGYGNAQHMEGMARSVARAVHYQVTPVSEVHLVPHVNTQAVVIMCSDAKRIAFDAIIDDGNEPDGYVSPNGATHTPRYQPGLDADDIAQRLD